MHYNKHARTPFTSFKDFLLLTIDLNAEDIELTNHEATFGLFTYTVTLTLKVHLNI